jgi:hypothetical protein
MRVETVEIYSDATNAAILRHPDRRFPGLLIQGDTLHTICVAIDRIHSKARSQMDANSSQGMDDLRNSM